MTTYAITTTNGQHIREQHRSATTEDLATTLAAVAQYIGLDGGPELQDGGCWVVTDRETGREILVARPTEA